VPGGHVSQLTQYARSTVHIGWMPFALVLAPGSWIFLGFVVLFFLAISHGYYSRSGSAINQHPYTNGSGDAPGAEIPSTIGRDVDRRDFSRGTR
jgi:hypothetical protein